MPILREGELDIISHSAEQTRRLGVRLGMLLARGDVICLSGDMGAGKTVFAAGIGAGWGAQPPLTSPTFNLAHPHTRAQDTSTLYHLDCYRLRDAADAETIGLDDMLNGEHILVLEWPERIESVLPEACLWIELRVLEPTRRNFVFEATGARYEALLKQFQGSSFLSQGTGKQG
jgi:tRNA threonylcarbamoyladenosine biosynthesis protein TsaE